MTLATTAKAVQEGFVADHAATVDKFTMDFTTR